MAVLSDLLRIRYDELLQVLLDNVNDIQGKKEGNDHLNIYVQFNLTNQILKCKYNRIPISFKM